MARAREVFSIQGGRDAKRVFELADSRLEQLCSQWATGAPVCDSTVVAVQRSVEVPYSKIWVESRGKPKALLAIGKDLEIHDYDSLGDELLREDVDNLDKALRRGSNSQIESAARKLFASSIIGTIGESAHINDEKNAQYAHDEIISSSTKNFVSKSFVGWTRASIRSLVRQACVEAHKIGVAASVLIGLSALVLLSWAPRHLPWFPIDWYMPALAGAIVAAGTELVMRRTAILDIRISDEKRLAHLVGDSGIERLAQLIYAMLIAGIGATGFWLTHR